MSGTGKKEWSRGDKIGIASLVITVVAAIAAWLVVPEIRRAAKLDSPDQPSPHREQSQSSAGKPSLSPSAAGSVTASPEDHSSEARVTKAASSQKPAVDKSLEGLWMDETVTADHQPLLLEFMNDSTIRFRNGIHSEPYFLQGYVWYRNGSGLRLIAPGENGNLSHAGVRKGDVIEGTVTIEGRQFPWKMERVHTR